MSSSSPKMLPECAPSFVLLLLVMNSVNLFYCAPQWIKNLLFLVTGDGTVTSYLHHSCSFTCNTLRGPRTELGFRKHFAFSPAWAVGCLLSSILMAHSLGLCRRRFPAIGSSLASTCSISPTQHLWLTTQSLQDWVTWIPLCLSQKGQTDILVLGPV